MQNFIALILEPLREVYGKFAKFVPNLLAMLIIILVGLLLARIVRAMLLKLLHAVNFDTWSDRMGLTQILRKGDLWGKPAGAIGALTYWFLVITTLMAGVSALNIPSIDNLISQFILYIPRVLSAMLILIVGYILTGFISRAVLIAGVNKGYHFARLLAEAVRLLLIVFFLAMALEQLQVAPGIVVSAFTVIFGGIVLALAIAFGVGGIDAARKIIGAEMEKKDEGKRDIEHI
jgi:hypothetical protein